ncbi:MAG TPA: TIGR03435 family protein, partial [Vicinamibacterales bacterium]|nr:TIGR03435 family protein [Vicinamibacterales bacterium]
MRLVSLATALICAAAVAQPHGQTFDTASVKPNQSATCDRDGTLAGGRFAMTCSTLRELVTFAYPRQSGRLRGDTEITGGPSWINADHFDVIGKIPEGKGLGFDAGNTGSASVTSAQLSAIDQVRAMVRAVLVDRFKLAVRHETRELPAYELQMDKADGRLGPRLEKVDADCAGRPASGHLCGGFRTMAPGHIVGGAVPMSLLAQFL